MDHLAGGSEEVDADGPFIRVGGTRGKKTSYDVGITNRVNLYEQWRDRKGESEMKYFMEMWGKEQTRGRLGQVDKKAS